MSRIVKCQCGHVVEEATDDELITAVERHVGERHPELVGKLSREDILGMAETA